MTGRYHRNSRYPGDEDDLTESDEGWVGVDMQTSPEKVDRNKVSWAYNKRFRRREADTRLGIQEQTWAAVAGVNGIFDTLVFSSVSGYEWLLRATDTAVLIDRPEASGTISLPAGVTLDNEVQLIQAFNEVYLLRGANDPALKWVPGADPANPATNAFEVVPSADISGFVDTPRGLIGLWARNRLWIGHDQDKVSPSDILKPTEYDPNKEKFVERGAHDELVQLYARGTEIIAFKSESIFAMGPIDGSIDEVVTDELTREFGLKAKRSVAAFGKELWLLSDFGVMTFSQVLDNRLQGVSETMSRDVQPMIERINWAKADGIVAAFWDSKYYLAIPVDGSDYNNAVLVYDAEVKAWQGVDGSEKHRVVRWEKMRVGGHLRLFFVDPDGVVFLYEEGREDEWDGEGQPILDDMITRGYLCQTDRHKKFVEGEVHLATQDPEYTISSVVNGHYDA